MTVLAKETEDSIRLSPELQAELEQALEEAELEEGISAADLLKKLKKHG